MQFLMNGLIRYILVCKHLTINYNLLEILGMKTHNVGSMHSIHHYIYFYHGNCRLLTGREN